MEQQQVARRIVAINKALMQKLDILQRKALVAEQRILWDSEFPGFAFDQIERVSVH